MAGGRIKPSFCTELGIVPLAVESQLDEEGSAKTEAQGILACISDPYFLIITDDMKKPKQNFALTFSFVSLVLQLIILEPLLICYCFPRQQKEVCRL